MMEKYPLIIVVAPADVNTLLYALPYIQKKLPISKINIIGNFEVHKILLEKKVCNDLIHFLLEDEIIQFAEVKQEIERITSDEGSARRTGWYLQQFLKMKYAEICQEKYYIIWDADTIPLQTIHFFENGTPLFDLKDEWNPAYFDTMSRLIPGLDKKEQWSFISEHMIISTDIMRTLINEIEENYVVEEEIPPFWKVILRSINLDDLPGSGFSEFETYGNYCMMRYPDLYRKKEYDSFRFASKYFVLAEMTESDFHWIARDYPAASFEKMMTPYRYYRVFRWPLLQKIFHIKSIFRLFDESKRLWNRVRNRIRGCLFKE